MKHFPDCHLARPIAEQIVGWKNISRMLDGVTVHVPYSPEEAKLLLESCAPLRQLLEENVANLWPCHCQLRAERVEAMRTLDLQWARDQIPKSYIGREIISSYGLLVGMHKARYECTDIEDALRHHSRAWLQSRGFGRRDASMGWPADNQLPDDEGKVL